VTAAALLARAAIDPLAWMKLFIPASVPADYATHHRQVCTLPDPGHSQVRVVWRGSAKTTLTRGFVTWCAERGKVRGVLWVRATGADGKADREAIERLCQQRGLNVHHDGVLQMLVVEGVPIWTRSPGGAVRGLNWTNPETGEVVRPDLAIIDDLETRETARSKTQTDNIQTWLFSDALQTGTQSHPLRTIVLGTPITPTCLISKAMRREAPFDTWDEPLVVPVVNADGTPNWPAVYDPGLEGRVPPITFSTEYLLETLPEGTLYFPPGLTVWKEPPERLPVIVGVDPSGDGEDATGIAAVGLDAAGLHVVDAVAWNGSAADMPDQVAAFVRRLQAAGHPVHGVLFEANRGAWQWPARTVRELVAPVRVQTEAPRLSKGERAIPVTLWHKSGQVSMSPRLRGTPADSEFHSFTIDEQTVSGHDDVFDAVVWACGAVTKGHTVRPTVG